MAAGMIPIPLPPRAMPLPPAPAVKVTRELWQMDIECYIDYFLVKFYCSKTREFQQFELTPGTTLDVVGVNGIVTRATLVTFNGNSYDVPMLAAALAGYDCAALKRASDAIIVGRLKPWQFEREFNVRIPSYLDVIDLIEVAPGQASLKIYGGKLHSWKIQDLPIEPSASIPPALYPTMREYCGNDLYTTDDLYRKFEKEIALRTLMSAEYGVDLRSKSDAQIAEAVIKSEIGFNVERPYVAPGTQFLYKTPHFIKFQTPALRDIVAMIERSPFTINAKEVLTMPPELQAANITIGKQTYKLGMGGLHSTESSIYHVSDDDYVLSDHDAASFYPFIIIICGLYPSQMGDGFLRVFKSIVDRRIAAKKAGDKKTADTLKIVINGTFGKLGSRFSILYAPDLMVQTTVTGQLVLLMLIEMLELSGIQVVSANTDGIVIKCHRSAVGLRDGIVKWWEQATGFETEANEYRALLSRDVNSYFAIKPDGTVKLKGEYSAPEPIGSSWPSPANEVCIDAVVAYLTAGVPIEETIYKATDVRRFVVVRKVGDRVAGGGVWTLDGSDLGTAVRWYYACVPALGLPLRAHIAYKKNGNKVGGSDGAKPLMELPPFHAVPADVDYDWYIKKAYSILGDLGLRK